jgi:hypothetical protein
MESAPVFISYSFKDLDWKNQIVGVLRSRGIDVWEDSRPRTGDDWDSEIHGAIDGARVAVLLISPNYLSSETIQGEQVPYLLGRANFLRLYPILIDPCEWQNSDWLQGIQMFPSDLQPLIAAEGSQLAARLALAALEIGGFADIATLSQSVSARVTESDGRFVGMAALVYPDLALSVIAGVAQDKEYQLEFPGRQPSTVQATVELTDSSLNLSLLRLYTPIPLDVTAASYIPQPGAVWECLTYQSVSSPSLFATGIVLGTWNRNGRLYLHLKPSIEDDARGMNGAPIIVNNVVVAVLESHGGAILDEWFAIPLSAVESGPIGAAIRNKYPTPTPQSPKPQQSPPAQPEPDFDPAAFFARLTDNALASLERAEAWRLVLNQSKIHMEHLLVGLYRQPDSPMRRLARDAKLFNERDFRKLFSANNAGLASGVTLVSDPKLTSLPPISGHVRKAFVAAQKTGPRAIGRRILMNAALSVQDCGVVTALRNAIPPDQRQTTPGSVTNRSWLPEVSADIPGDKDTDLLNIERDVGALCSVIAAADAALPLSIGLFGDWGTGKSFFMKEMKQKIVNLERLGPPTYCSHIVQLKFNAWHYMDTTLWASLTSEIFEGLATELSDSPGAAPESTADRLLADISSSRDKLADAECKKRDVEAQLAESERNLQDLQNSEAEISASLSPRVLFTEAARLALEQDEVKNELDKAAKELNLPQVTAASDTVRKDLLELRGIWSAMLLAMRNTERLWTWLVALALLVAAIFGLLRLVPLLVPQKLESVKGLLAGAAATLGGLAALLGPFLVPAKRALKFLQDARKKSDEIVQRQQAERRQELEAARTKKKSEVDEKNKAVEDLREKIDKLDNAIQQLRADRQMFDFIRKRNASTDYTSHLGVIARAHKDFRELSALLARVRDEKPDSDNRGIRRVERIVLYIDDLDRCPEDKVMDVLQAVHLLLAFPLFVVVVGVDPRWLLHSVAERSLAFRRDEPDTKDLWRSSPLNYLEKIFQIPFTLRPMSSQGFGQLVDAVAGTRTGTSVDSTPPPVTPGAPASPSAQPAAAPQPGRPAQQPAELKKPTPATPGPTKSSPAAEPLKIEPWERDFMKQLHCLIPSPRAGKRFINIYRMIRSTIDGAKWDAFVGDKDRGGQHRQALLLLAILTGYPKEAAEILRRLIEREHNETWWEFFASLETTTALTAEGWPELRAKLNNLRNLIPETEGCDVFREYAPQVARYSFQSGRALLAQQLPETDN